MDDGAAETHKGGGSTATDIHNTRKKSNNREHARVANGMRLSSELLHALSTRFTQLNLSALSASPRLCVRYLEAARRRISLVQPPDVATHGDAASSRVISRHD